MTITSRAFRVEVDYHKVRQLLVESYGITGQIHNWGIERWDVLRYVGHAQDELAQNWPWEANVHLWEDQTGKVIGVVHPEDGRDLFFEIHPDYRHIEAEMLDWAEAHHQATRPSGAAEWPLNTYVYEYDTQRAALLTERGYENQGHDGYTRRRSLAQPIPDIHLPDGYSIRTLRRDDRSDLEKRAIASARTFRGGAPIPDTFADTMRMIQRAPTYRNDLDLVVIAPDGAVAAFTIVWLDDVNHIAFFEPVGTDPDHRQRKLASAIMAEGLRRAKTLDAKMAYLGCGDDVNAMPANRLYESIGFVEADRSYHWQKLF